MVSLIENVSRGACKIKTGEGTGSGAFVKFYFNQSEKCIVLKGLVTNHHVLGWDSLEDGEVVNVETKYSKLSITILANTFRFTCPLLDFTFILFARETVEVVIRLGCKFLRVSSSLRQGEAVAILQFPGDEDLSCCSGEVVMFWGCDFFHTVSKERGSSGSMVVDHNGQVIGVHKARHKTEEYNVSVRMKYAMSALEKVYETGEKFARIKILSSDDYSELENMGLKEKNGVLISPWSFGVTTIWFYRTPHHWFWTPTQPDGNRDSDLRQCNWTLISNVHEAASEQGRNDQRIRHFDLSFANWMILVRNLFLSFGQVVLGMTECYSRLLRASRGRNRIRVRQRVHLGRPHCAPRPQPYGIASPVGMDNDESIDDREPVIDKRGWRQCWSTTKYAISACVFIIVIAICAVPLLTRRRSPARTQLPECKDAGWESSGRLGELTTNAANANGSVHAANASGSVYAVSRKHLLLLGFSYRADGRGAYFYVGKGRNGIPVPHPTKGSKEPLRDFRNETVFLRLPRGTSIEEIAWFAIYVPDRKVCRSVSVCRFVFVRRSVSERLAHVDIPGSFEPCRLPGMRARAPLDGNGASTRGPLVVLDEGSIVLPGFASGNASDIRFYLFDAENVLSVPSPRLSTSAATQDVLLQLPWPRTLNATRFIWIWCPRCPGLLASIYPRECYDCESDFFSEVTNSSYIVPLLYHLERLREKTWKPTTEQLEMIERQLQTQESELQNLTLAEHRGVTIDSIPGLRIDQDTSYWHLTGIQSRRTFSPTRKGLRELRMNRRNKRYGCTKLFLIPSSVALDVKAYFSMGALPNDGRPEKGLKKKMTKVIETCKKAIRIPRRTLSNVDPKNINRGLGPLRDFRDETVFLRLPRGTSIEDIAWFAIYVPDRKERLAHVDIPGSFQPCRLPGMRARAPLDGSGASTRGPLVVLDEGSIVLPGFASGNASDIRFYLFDAETVLSVPSPRLSTSATAQDVLLRLPWPRTLNATRFIWIWCPRCPGLLGSFYPRECYDCESDFFSEVTNSSYIVPLLYHLERLREKTWKPTTEQLEMIERQLQTQERELQNLTLAEHRGVPIDSIPGLRGLKKKMTKVIETCKKAIRIPRRTLSNVDPKNINRGLGFNMDRDAATNAADGDDDSNYAVDDDVDAYVDVHLKAEDLSDVHDYRRPDLGKRAHTKLLEMREIEQWFEMREEEPEFEWREDDPEFDMREEEPEFELREVEPKSGMR
ncbi:unnamed protein product [Darwinula stevensoni]|uniref:DM13 domain-containing protein n=1 Tax=Darwinula stevensoni TaxID=69355 RepID=A0A7R9A9Z2_9CRUS|nr:unnamed protein product [Darwinula stevensoni]CAG0897926.1 unnamed protein product [Darwinula stevensoni]